MSFLDRLFGKKHSTSSEKPFVEVLPKIYPYFKQFLPHDGDSMPLPTDFTEIEKDKVYELPGRGIVFKNICEDLNCLYAIDNGHSFDLIQYSHISHWGVDEKELHEVALENFRTMIAQKLSVRGDTNGIMLILDGNLEAGLVLIEEIWEQYEEQVGEKIVIAVPSRDVIMSTGVSNKPMIDQFKRNCKKILVDGDHPLSKNLFIREHSEWKLFERIVD